MLKNKRLIWIIISSLGVVFVFGGFVFYLQARVDIDSVDIPIYGNITSLSGVEVPKIIRKSNHLKTPQAVKAIYMTSCVAGTLSLRDKLVDFVTTTELNSLVIDIKDYTGTISYKPNDESLLHLWEDSRCGVVDMEDFIKSLHEKDIYVIGRITVFQDPHLAKRQPELAVKFASNGEVWKDRKGLNFTDPGSEVVWDYHVALARDAYNIGFDELNFDYIRFPSDGPMNDIYFPFSKNHPKPEVLESFFSYLSKKLKPEGVIMSADLFGMTATNTDDLNIGQVLERALPYFDYVDPMVYPSHYPNGFNGWSDPNEVPYEIIKYSMDIAVARTIATSTVVKTNDGQPIASTTPQLYTKESYDKNKIRPWLQDFDYPVTYTADDVRAQIKATYDAGLNSWLMWDPSNKYTKEVYKVQ